MIRTYFQAGIWGVLALYLFLGITTASAATCTPESLTQVFFGESGASVGTLQQCLIEAGYSIHAGATGYYGEQTRAAVRELYRLELAMAQWDGASVGPQGRSALGRALAKGGANALGGEAKSKEFSYTQVTSKEEMQKYLEASEEVPLLSRGITNLTSGAVEKGLEDSVELSASAQSSRHSVTNVQVGGIDEPDVVKTDGEHIYIAPQSFVLYRDSGEGVVSSDSITSVKIATLTYTTPSTKIVDAFPLSDLGEVGEDAIEESGDMLLMGDMLIIFTPESIVGYDVTDAKNPKKKWEKKYGDSVQLQTARAKDGVVYIVTSTSLYKERPCPVVPLLNAGLVLPCTRVWVPEKIGRLDTSYSVLALNPNDGGVEKEITFGGEANNTVVAVFEGSLYVTHRETFDTGSFLFTFLETEFADMLSSTARERIATIKGYDISIEAKMLEVQNLIEDETSDMTENEELRFTTEFGNRFTQYKAAHAREMDRTIVSRIDLDTLTIQTTKSIPGYLLNQFSIDEYEGHLRVAVTVGDRWSSDTQVNDVYVLDETLEIVGSVLDLGFTEQVYSARFVGDRGYVVTFRQTDPLYVFDLSDPMNPKMTGELKIPGYSSYLEVLDENRVLGVGRDGANVKLSLFNVSNPVQPTEQAVYLLKESWSEVENNHHAFLKDATYGVVFVPASNGGYVISYANDVLTLKAAVSGYDVRRAVFIDEYLYVVGDSSITALNENTWKEEKVLEL